MDSAGRRGVPGPGPGDRGRARDRGRHRRAPAARRASPELTARLVALVDELGLSTLAELWADRPARSLPGALWRLYALREWVRRDPVGASADYAAGIRFADVNARGRGRRRAARAGRAAASSPTRSSRGVFDGDLADRARAGGRVLPRRGLGARPPRRRLRRPQRAATRGGAAQTRRAASMLTTGEDLEASARLWRTGDLP